MAITFTERYVTATASGGGDGSSGNPWTWDEAVTNVAAGDRVNVKAGNYSTTGSSSTTSGSLSQPIVFRGYKDAIGDMDGVPLHGLVDGTDIPTIDSTADNQGAKGQFIYFNNMSFTTNSAYKIQVWNLGLYGAATHCRFISTQPQSSCPATGYTFFGCYFETASNYTALRSARLIDNCVFRGVNGGITGPIGISGLHGVCTNSLFVNFSLAFNFSYPSVGLASNNTFVDCTTAINFATNNPDLGARIISNNYFYNCTTAVNDGYRTEEPTFHMINNGFYNVTTQADTSIAFNVNPKVDSVDPFVDYANGDYRLKPFSVGYGQSEQKTFDYYDIINNRDLGAIQHADPSPATQPSAAGTQIYPFRQFVSDKFGAVLHPLRSN